MENKSNLLFAVLCMALALPAQTPTEQLAQAKLIEESEQDLARAIALYRELAGRDGLETDLQSRVQLRLGLALRRVGEEAAAVEALVAAAEGTGSAAVKARQLQDPKQDAFLGGKVLQLLDELKDSTARKWSDDLVWIGRQALPMIMRSVDAEEIDLAYVTKAAATVFVIGGDEIEEWFETIQRDYGALKRRAVIRAFQHLNKDTSVSAYARFAVDPDPEVRRELVSRRDTQRPFSTWLALAEDPDASVRRAALSSLQPHFPWGDELPVNVKKLMGIIRESEGVIKQKVFHRVLNEVMSRLTRKQLENDVPALQYWANVLLEAGPRAGPDAYNNVYKVLRVIGSLGTRESIAWVRELHTKIIPIKGSAYGRDSLVKALGDRFRNGSEAIRKSMRALMTDSDIPPISRSMAGAYLMSLGDVPSIELYAAGYKEGDEFDIFEGTSWRYKAAAYTDAQSARILETCLSTGSPGAWGGFLKSWREHYDSFTQAQQVAVIRSLSMARRGYLIGILEKLPHWPMPVTENSKESRVLLELLRHESSKIRMRAVELLKWASSTDELRVSALLPMFGDDDVDVIEKAVDALSSISDGDSRILPAVLALLAHPNSQLRATAIRTIGELDRENTPKHFAKASRDLDHEVRLAVMYALASSPDWQGAVEILLSGIEDSHSRVRKVANRSLTQLRRTIEEKARWQRILDGSGIDAGNAAEALANQATRGKTKPMRLAAIQSLGTLAKPETLPILIKLMGDSDADLAAAAAAAVKRINAKEH